MAKSGSSRPASAAGASEGSQQEAGAGAGGVQDDAVHEGQPSGLPSGRVPTSEGGGYTPATLGARLARYLGETLGASGVELRNVADHVSTVRFRFGEGHPLRVTVCREEQLEIVERG